MQTNKKKYLKIFVNIIIVIVLTCTGVNFTLATVNCVLNSSQDVAMQNNLILNQDKLSNLRLGFLSADNNSCGAISTYNFLTLNNQKANFNDILRFYDAYGTNVFGVLGINPFCIQTLLRLRGYNANVTINKQKMPQLAKQSGTSIFLYFHSSGGHYITLQYDKNSDNFKTYNYFYGRIYSIKLENLTEKYNGLCLLIYIN